MIYGSVCSGIEAATVAWHPLGWRPAFLSEIERYARALLKYHYPDVPLHGDFTTIKGDEYGSVDLLVAGTPCQDFSVAGLRAGLAGDRGRLTIEFVHLLARLRPRWVVWENVPGVLSVDEGQAFGIFLGLLGQLGYGFAYRILDAQYFGVAQRRRRVFVVGHLGDWRPAAAVFFEPKSLSGYPAPRREPGQRVAGTFGARATAGGGFGTDFEIDVAKALSAQSQVRWDESMDTYVTHALTAEGFDASEDGTGRGVPVVAFDCKRDGSNSFDLAPTLPSRDRPSKPGGGHAVAFQCHGGNVGEMGTLRGSDGLTSGVPFTFNLRGRDGGAAPEVDDIASIRSASGGSSRSYVTASVVRRLTPRECERLQGFPDDYTLVPYRNKPAADGPRYRALGNSMAVPVMVWIGRRIDLIESLEVAS